MATVLSFLSSPPCPSPSPSQRPHSIRRRFAFTSFLSSHPPRPRPRPPRPPPHLLPLRSLTLNPRKPRTLTVSSSFSSSSAFDDLSSAPNSCFAGSAKGSVLSSMIQEIEPLDVTLIQKDVPPTTLDAMKRTISSMLGLLPSDRFQVFIEAPWDPLSKLLVSSMMTGYTLRNAEYRLFLEQNLDIHDADHENQIPENSKTDLQGMSLDNDKMDEFSGKNELSTKFEEVTDNPSDDLGIQGLGELSPEVQKYILQLQSRLLSAKKELYEVKRKSAALQMQQFVGEEKNDLLDYLRSLQPEKVAELSEPTSPELKETIHSVVHGLLATLSPKIHSKAPPLLENTSTGTVNIGTEDYAELVDNTSLQFQPHVSLTRDYLARLLFWCMLLGHYLRGLEYRMDLTQLLSLTNNAENEAHGDKQVA